MEMSKQSTSGINKIEAKRQEVIDYILTEINNGNPHVFNNPNHPSLFEQYNFKTDKTYSGMNRFILAISASLEGYKDPRWLTYKQAKELGYSVKKGTHGTTLEYWERIPVKMDKLDKDGNPVLDENGKPVQVTRTREDGTPVMRWMGKPFTVFNGEQINGIPPYERQPMTEEQRIKELESILDHSEAPIHYDSLEANYYQRKTDTIHLRPKDDFKSMDQLYATALHEIAHSTQHPSRLNRQYMEASNPLEELQNYAREEVVAEFTAAMLNAKYNLPYSERMGKDNSTSYIEGWQQVFNESPLELIEALKKAEQAATYIENNMLVLEQEQTEQLEQSPSLNQYSLDDLEVHFDWAEGMVTDKDGKSYTRIGVMPSKLSDLGTDTGNYYSDNLILKGKAAQQFLTDAARQDYFYSELGHAKCSFTIKVKDFEFGDRFDLGDSYIKSANLNGKKEVGGIEYFNNFLVKTFDVDPHTLENLVTQEQQLIAEGKLPSITNCPNGQIITNDMNQDNLIPSSKKENTVKFDKNFAISLRHKEGFLCRNTNMIVLGGGTSFDYLLQDTPEKMIGPDDGYREYGGHFYALDHDPESPNLYKGDYAIQLMNDIVLEDMTVHLVNANRTITIPDGTGFDSQNPTNVRSCLGVVDKLGINFHIIDKNGELHTFKNRIDLGDLDTISKTPMLDVLKSMENWTSVKLEGLSDDVHAMVEELEDRLKRNELPSPSVQTNPKIYTEKLQALYNSHSNPEKYAEALKPVIEMLNVTQTKDLSQKPKVGLSISKPKGKSGLER